MLPADLPADLPSFLARFGSDEQGRDDLFDARWPDGFRCTGCGHGQAWHHKLRLIDECAGCGKQHSLLAGDDLRADQEGRRSAARQDGRCRGGRERARQKPGPADRPAAPGGGARRLGAKPPWLGAFRGQGHSVAL